MIKDLRKKKKKGFSLVELIVVIAIIGILAAIAVPKYSQYKASANKRADEVTAKLLAEATLMAYESGDLTGDDVTDGTGDAAGTGVLTNDGLNDVWAYVKGGTKEESITDGAWQIKITVTTTDVGGDDEATTINSSGTIEVTTVDHEDISHKVEY